MSGFAFTLEARDGRARAGRLQTPHGAVLTPVFMPVGTAGAVKAVLHRDLVEIGAQVLLANTYHLMLRPGDALVASLGGLTGFTGWKGPFLTDSGGYQVFSLAALRRLDEEGVRFRSHVDGSPHFLSPERSIEIQQNLGADIAMAFDECPPGDSPREVVQEATERTTRWAERSRSAHTRSDQWLFGIVQGGVHLDLREASARALIAIGFPGYAIGGLSVGEPKPGRDRVLEHLEGILPAERPRYLMGVGHARGPDRGRRARRRHVRLRAAHAQRPKRPALHEPRPDVDPERPLPRRPAAARSRLPLPHLPQREPRLPPSPASREGDERRDADDDPQPVLLP